MKKVVALLLSFILVLSLTSCNTSGSTSSLTLSSKETLSSETLSNSESNSTELSSHENSIVPSTKISEKDKEQLKNISVTYRADSLYNDAGKQRMIVIIENKGDKIFNGDVAVTFWSDDQSLGSDIFPVKELKPGNNGRGEIYIIPDRDFNFIYDISDYSFTEDTVGSNGKEDEKMSKVLTQKMYENFGGCGNKAFTTSWYPYIKKLTVYKNNDNYYVIAITSSNKEEVVNHIGNAVFGNTASGDGVDGILMNGVIVKDEAGKILFKKSK
ncbi:hypothetical protein FL966_05850 [Caproiciproducens galactitolivorans]|uniref:Uncharacterized protein n=1 Tax=Caproiciproducens galactitolivorans TaxID=642589 RepID=A0A4Z0Y940_9FIRM|nr:hypothetical protein [Caproiciproducens galactitolivorans]QEY34613.1 hypothetical protein FL966_05850 [Caproiciproducens galactitolivorans]TGJ75423.1 hypothetical protein CAGA_24480 [Caproiciproducens galactitolivorans]